MSETLSDVAEKSPSEIPTDPMGPPVYSRIEEFIAGTPGKPDAMVMEPDVFVEMLRREPQHLRFSELMEFAKRCPRGNSIFMTADVMEYF